MENGHFMSHGLSEIFICWVVRFGFSILKGVWYLDFSCFWHAAVQSWAWNSCDSAIIFRDPWF